MLPRLESDIYELFSAAVDGRDCELRWSPFTMLGVVLASNGYPGSYAKGAIIKGADEIDGRVFHMGTKRDADGCLLTSGGRVMMVVGSGKDLAEARAKANLETDRVKCDNLFHRSDIGLRGESLAELFS